MSKLRIIGEYFAFLRQEKKWWMFPIVAVLLLFGSLIIPDAGQSARPVHLHSVLEPGWCAPPVRRSEVGPSRAMVAATVASQHELGCGRRGSSCFSHLRDASRENMHREKSSRSYRSSPSSNTRFASRGKAA